MTPSASEEKDFLDYSELSKAFENKAEDFRKMLKMVLEDFMNNHMLLIEALTDKNREQFLKIHHNLRANIILFKIQTFEKLLVRLEGALLEGPLDEKQSIEDLHYSFNTIFESLENKIISLD